MDLYFFHLINNFSGRWPALDSLGIFTAEYLGYFLILSFLFLLVREKNWRERWYFLTLTGLSLILSRGIAAEIIRFFYSRLRPFAALGIQSLISEVPNNSFPSGNAAFFFALAFSVYLFLRGKKNQEYSRKKWNYWFFGIAVIIGIARIFVGVHWPSDVLGGAMVGFLSALLMQQILPSSMTSGDSSDNSKLT